MRLLPLLLVGQGLGLRAPNIAPTRAFGRCSQLVMKEPDQTGMTGTRNWYNDKGERVIRKEKKAASVRLSSLRDDPLAAFSAASNGTDDGLTRRWVLGTSGALLVPLGLSTIFKIQDVGERQADKKLAAQKSDLDGDAVSVPALEESLELLVKGGGGAAAVAALVRVLEERQGAQYAASSKRGKWVMPWVGGWERLTTSETDQSFIGGPKGDSYKGMRLVSARQFVYGPGPGGLINEFLYAPPASSDPPSGEAPAGASASAPADAPASGAKLLLSRSGALENLGGNYFKVGWESPLQAFEVRSDDGEDALAADASAPAAAPAKGGSGAAGSESLLRTTYLTASMWIIRGGEGDADGKFVVFKRTETQSVMDRRGLVADGQLKPSSDDTIRYGRLLFGESLSDYAGWGESGAGP